MVELVGFGGLWPQSRHCRAARLLVIMLTPGNGAFCCFGVGFRGPRARNSGVNLRFWPNLAGAYRHQVQKLHQSAGFRQIRTCGHLLFGAARRRKQATGPRRSVAGLAPGVSDAARRRASPGAAGPRRSIYVGPGPGSSRWAPRRRPATGRHGFTHRHHAVARFGSSSIS